jgi:predicted nucleic acid-binding Zn ribbon protein
MPTYVYETIPQREGETSRRFEIRQSMTEAALQQHPETGEPVRRVPVGGTGIMGSASSSNPASAAASRGGCGTGCGCH